MANKKSKKKLIASGKTENYYALNYWSLIINNFRMSVREKKLSRLLPKRKKS